LIYGITGHTYGFGKYISERLIADGHSIIGISRSTGFDLTVNSDLGRAVQSMSKCDIIINNTSAGNRQTVLLNQLRLRYLPFDKTIINVGSWITQVDLSMLHEIDVDQYIDKRMLQTLSNTIGSTGSTLKSVYLTWGFHLGNPILNRYPELQDTTTVEEAVDQLVSWNQ
jgi:NADP-dependent 3-hydroxy acid dehydrogenase YdfG